MATPPNVANECKSAQRFPVGDGSDGDVSAAAETE